MKYSCVDQVLPSPFSERTGNYEIPKSFANGGQEGRLEKERRLASVQLAPGLSLLAFQYFFLIFFFFPPPVKDAPLEPGALISARPNNGLPLYAFIYA